MRYALLLSLTLLLALPVRAADPAPTPETTLHAFYGWVLDHPSYGVPDAEERAKLAPLLSAQLVDLLAQAAETDARCVKTAQEGDKPDVYEGDLFVGIYEGATDVAFHKVTRKGDVATADIDLINIDARFPKADSNRAYVWKNTIELRKTGAGWLVQNVRFDRKTSLVSVLRDHIAQGARSCR